MDQYPPVLTSTPSNQGASERWGWIGLLPSISFLFHSQRVFLSPFGVATTEERFTTVRGGLA